ncbi:hypothetical protein [Streptomyces californicus]
MTTPERTEYVWGIDSTVDDDSTRYRPPHAVSFPVVKKTPKRVYYECRGMTRFVDRQRLEADGQVYRLSSGWWEADSTVYLNEPAVYRHMPPSTPSLAELKQAMADAHPDRGGTDAEFIAARARYERARTTTPAPAAG